MGLPQMVVARDRHEMHVFFDDAAGRVLYYCPTCGRIDYRRQRDQERLLLVQGDTGADHYGGILGTLEIQTGTDLQDG